MKYAIITGFTAATILIAGCGKKIDSASSSATPSPASHPVLTAWQQGDKAAAVTNFMATDWNAHPLFASGSILSLREDQLKALSAAEIAARLGELRAARPHDFEISPDQLQRWHRREKIDSQRAGNDFAARFHTRQTTLPDFD